MGWPNCCCCCIIGTPACCIMGCPPLTMMVCCCCFLGRQQQKQHDTIMSRRKRPPPTQAPTMILATKFRPCEIKSSQQLSAVTPIQRCLGLRLLTTLPRMQTPTPIHLQTPKVLSYRPFQYL
ncbi:Hypothetical_protein [Hexamita inflata]|uniref:Hypothetical_protein n=1 Tax=Hexamita inflata TaxID=28002 RepID=A0AA86RHV0_9EUKA|nr:Hypothetical protein HINF_LOCUS66349 [Hexamita inflata]